MKKIFIIISLLITFFEVHSIFALDAFWYSATAYSAEGAVLPNETSLFVKVTVNDATHIYSSELNGVKTDQFGVFSIRVGNILGSGTELSTVNLTNKTKLKVEIKKLENDSYNTVSEKLLISSVMEATSSSNPANLKWFYMPSVVINTETTGTNRQIDLYSAYTNQFTGSDNTTWYKNTSAPSTIPYFPNSGDLYYYITYYDKTVLKINSLSDAGVLNYDVINNATPSSFINIIFVIK